jgi:hypothetical protein
LGFVETPIIGVLKPQFLLLHLPFITSEPHLQNSTN